MFGVVMANLVLGWTVLGWLGALLCACSGHTEGDILRLHTELLATLERHHAARVTQGAAVSDNPNGYNLVPLPRGLLLDDGARLPHFPL